MIGPIDDSPEDMLWCIAYLGGMVAAVIKGGAATVKENDKHARAIADQVVTTIKERSDKVRKRGSRHHEQI